MNGPFLMMKGVLILQIDVFYTDVRFRQDLPFR